jgi:arginyl-tRNA synthetase
MLSMQNTMKIFFTDVINELLKRNDISPLSTESIVLTVATKAIFGDYQCNQAMPLAKVLKKKPGLIAEEIVSILKTKNQSKEFFKEITATPQGFINLQLNTKFLEKRFNNLLKNTDSFGIEKENKEKFVIIDYSSPNIAKEMHVGHLRSTIIGEAIARTLEFKGFKVERINHIGDWGTQFGMLIRHLKDKIPDLENTKSLDISDLVMFYKEAKKRFDTDDKFKDEARKEVINLQSGKKVNIDAWNYLCNLSRQSFNEIYSLLDVKLIERGESFYNQHLPEIVNELDSKSILKISDGARCVFIEGIKNRDGDLLPLIVQKSDGGYNYDTTDLAALRYRLREQNADWVIYVTDKGQSTHFQQLFGAAKMARWTDDKHRLIHIGFGLVLGEDKKKFKTRSGETVKLKDLLNEAIVRARAIVDEKNPDFNNRMKSKIANVIGLGAVKYADLSQNRESDYVFSFDKMLQLQGNTAPYLIYVYVRIQSILRKSGINIDKLKSEITIYEESERNLVFHILKFADLFEIIFRDFATQHLADYLFELCQIFNRFYKQCPVLNAETQDQKNSRLQLIFQSGKLLKKGLYLLGLDVIEYM